MTRPPRTRVACVATKGNSSNEEQRIQRLLSRHDPVTLPFDKADKRGSALRLVRALRAARPELLVVEGTGVVGGGVAIAARLLAGTPFVLSSGDAVAPFLGMRAGWARPGAEIYERLLYRLSAGFIGWTPYLTGRAMTWGAPRGVTAPGWAPAPPAPDARDRWRRQLGVPESALVVGLVGSLQWEPRRGYCYGLELVRAAARLRRDDVVVLVVGDGSGYDRLAAEAGALLGSRVLLPGPVPAADVVDVLAACDVGSLPQSRDLVGALRYTTKLSEYVAAGLPVITGRLPFAYDIGTDWAWRIAGEFPWTDNYAAALAALVDGLDGEEIAAKRAAVEAALPIFDAEPQVARVGAFIEEILEELAQPAS